MMPVIPGQITLRSTTIIGWPKRQLLERTPASVCVVRVSGAWRLVHGARSKIFIRIHLNRLRYRRLKAQTIKSMLSSMASLLRLSCPHEIGISYL